MRAIFCGLLVACSALLASESRADAVTLAEWTFETSVPETAGPLAPEVGIGSAISNSGGVYSNPAGWGSQESWSSNNWDPGEYFQFEVSTLGFTKTSVSWQQTGSNTGPANWLFQYSTDGASFTDVSGYTVTNDGWNTTATPAASEKSFDLSSITAIDNAADVFFRLTVVDTVRISGADPVAATGTGRVDNFKVTAVPEPSSLAVLGLIAAGAVTRRGRRSAAITE